QRVEVSENLKTRTLQFHIRPQDFEDQPEGGKSTWALFYDAHRQTLEVMLFYLSESPPAVKFTEVYGRNGKLLEFKVIKQDEAISGVALTFKGKNSVSMRADQKYQLYSDAGAGPLYRIPKEVMIAVTLRVVHELDKRIK